MTIVNVREVTRGGRILGDFFPSSNRVTFLMGGGGGAFFTGASVLARSYGQK